MLERLLGKRGDLSSGIQYPCKTSSIATCNPLVGEWTRKAPSSFLVSLLELENCWSCPPPPPKKKPMREVIRVYTCTHTHAAHTGCVHLPTRGRFPAVRHAWSPPIPPTCSFTPELIPPKTVSGIFIINPVTPRQ